MASIGRDFCGCCDDSVYKLDAKSLEDQLSGTDNEGVKEVLQAYNLETELGLKGRELINWCLDFLLFKRVHKEDFLKSQVHPGDVHRTKYITIWSFIYNFLGIPQNSGYDYWLMSVLQWEGYMMHGSGIRCGWADKIPDRELSLEREAAILKWCQECPDNV
jgi:hypothetical protein